MSYQELRFDGRVALITGAGNGMGRTHAKLLASRGAAVLVNELPRSIHFAEDVVREITEAGGKAMAVAGAVGVDDDAKRMVQAAINEFGRIDIVINNAGIPNVISDEIKTAPSDSFDRFVDIHVKGPMQLNRAAWPHFVRQQYGKILFVGSSAATGWLQTSATGFDPNYAIVKAAIFALGRQTAGEGLGDHIHANILMPAAFSKIVKDNIGDTDMGKWMEENLTAESVSNGILYFLHEDCNITGEALTVQGGRIGRVYFASTLGYYKDGLTPEDVRDNIGKIMGTVNERGQLADAFEITFPLEQRIINEIVDQKEMPTLEWIAKQSLTEVNKKLI
ncbi:NAD(P)-dependent dehydrogenase (short-subunit alcohol dehydrogenase family) [Sphingobacterium paludis]|uniref:NAD(P)-dependent dehydrogenase (Short-subunit alcohol dehydrogenase family) n=2 Tax=Sphingobacterium paludis TaxID=1476465 RepID=A0A4R7DAW3_9SPHI|nr:NAD(P)-dependent dehydrogenase (short-subunit alcohol dehydrogenase family) [Sphingobacterium paludis]